MGQELYPIWLPRSVSKRGNRLNAGIEFRNSLNLFITSVHGANERRFALDSDNNIHRFFSSGDGTWHWPGSANQKKQV